VVLAEAGVIDGAETGIPIAGLGGIEPKRFDDGGRIAGADGEPRHLVAKG